MNDKQDTTENKPKSSEIKKTPATYSTAKKAKLANALKTNMMRRKAAKPK